MRQKHLLVVCLILLTSVLAVSAQPLDEPNPATAGPDFSATPAGPVPTSGLPARSKVSLPDYFYKHLSGTIGGKYRIVMNLTRIGGRLVGDYYYVDEGIPLFFAYGSTISSDGQIHLVETNELSSGGSSQVTGVFDGRFVGADEVSGTWKKSKSSPPLPFALSTAGVDGGSFDIAHYERGYYDRTHGSAMMDVTYPVMRTDSAETDAAFNENVLSEVVGMYENGVNAVAPTSVSQALEDFVRSFRAQLDQNNSFGYYPPWTYSITAHLLFNGAGILSLRYESFSFEGGAHPDTVYQNASYVRATGSVITLDELLKPGSLPALNAIGLQEFRREHGIAARESLSDAGYFVTDKSFQLNDNFLVTKAGLLFQFNQYEIAPYYFGAQQVIIPFAKIRSIIRAKSPIAALVDESGAQVGSGS